MIFPDTADLTTRRPHWMGDLHTYATLTFTDQDEPETGPLYGWDPSFLTFGERTGTCEVSGMAIYMPCLIPWSDVATLAPATDPDA